MQQVNIFETPNFVEERSKEINQISEEAKSSLKEIFSIDELHDKLLNPLLDQLLAMNKTERKNSLMEDTIENCFTQYEKMGEYELLALCEKHFSDELSKKYLKTIILLIRTMYNARISLELIKEYKKNLDLYIQQKVYTWFLKRNLPKKKLVLVGR